MASEGNRPRETRHWVGKTSDATSSEFSRRGAEAQQGQVAGIKPVRVCECVQSLSAVVCFVIWGGNFIVMAKYLNVPQKI